MSRPKIAQRPCAFQVLQQLLTERFAQFDAPRFASAHVHPSVPFLIDSDAHPDAICRSAVDNGRLSTIGEHDNGRDKSKHEQTDPVRRMPLHNSIVALSNRAINVKAALIFGATCLVFLCSPAMAQNPASFQTQTNLVLVPVVVRDSHGRAIGNLTKDDFELFDKRKRQTIVSFSLVKHGSSLREPEADTNPPNSEPAGSTFEMRPAGAAPPHSKPTNASPERFVIYLFDDLNVRFADMAAAQAAVVQHFRRGLPPTDRAAIYTFSGARSSKFRNHVALGVQGKARSVHDKTGRARVRKQADDRIHSPGDNTLSYWAEPREFAFAFATISRTSAASVGAW